MPASRTARVLTCSLVLQATLGASWPARAGAGGVAASPAPGPACPRVPVPPAPAPHLRAALSRHEPAIIVAIGSSSTRSWQASDPAHSYPGVLQARLADLLPHAHVAVINRGINGEDAGEEIARLQSDVVAVRPQLVIWQVGANGVLRDVDPAAFAKLVSAGVALLHRAGADVLLMDNQRAPRILAVPAHAAIDRALRQVAHDTESGLFDRAALMDAWAQAGAPYGLFIAPDNLHHNDLGYRCLAEAIATALVSGLGPAEPGGNGPGSNAVDAATPTTTPAPESPDTDQDNDGG